MKFDSQNGSHRLARKVVLRRAEPSREDHDVSSQQCEMRRLGKTFKVIADDAFAGHLHAHLVQFFS